MKFEINEGKIDRVLRVGVGLTLVLLAFLGVLSPLGYLGFLPILTGSLGWCPAYSILGINTCGIKKSN